MEKQSKILEILHSALDELELLAIEGENLDLEIVVGLQERFDKLKKIIEDKAKK